MFPADPNSPHSRVDDRRDEDSIEYEVEPPDPEASRVRERHGEQVVADALLRGAEPENWYHAEPWEAQLRWRFSLRDLFSVTAIIAITITVWRYASACPATVIGGLGTFFWLLIYMERMDPTLRGQRGQDDGDRPTVIRRRLPPLRISYSTADLLIAMTIAAVGFSLLRLFPPPLAAASLGFFVLGGIVMFWLGASPPRRAVLAWFILTAMYLVVSAIAIFQEP